MFKFGVFFVVWIIFVVATVALNEASKQKEVNARPELTVSADIDNEQLLLLQQALLDREYILALELIDTYQHYFADLPSSVNPQAYQFFYLKGHVHSALWQHMEASQSWTLALSFASTQAQKQRIQRLVIAGQTLIADINGERQLRGIYRATPNTGPASKLKGKVAVAYIFLTDGALQGWSLRERNFVMDSWSKAEQWLIDNSVKYDTRLSFSRRIFLVGKNPLINRLKVGDYNNQSQHANKVAQLVAEHFGEKNILSFIEKIKKEEAAEQAVLLFHLARDGRSFSQRCVIRCNADGEYVYLMEAPSIKRGNFMNYAQAHETLHLFGADDLYNIQAAKNYMVRDIMNYPASALEANTLEPITAFAIGISNEKPEVPFDIKVYSRSH